MIITNRTSGPLIPGTAVDTSGGLAYWTTPNNAKVEDAAVASDSGVGPGGGGHSGFPLELTNYGFAIPSAAIIDGIKLEAKVSGFSGMHDSDIYLKWASGTIGGFANAPNYGQFWGTTLNWLTWGGPTSLWGRTWTPAEINNSAFGAGLSGFPNSGTATANIDAVKITVYWHFDATVPAAEVPQRYDYKIYDPSGRFLGNLPNVTKPFATTQALNSTGAQLAIEAGGTPDGRNPTLAPGGLKRWLAPGWKYRQRIRISAGALTADMTGFPVYVNLADMGSQFWASVDSTGKDIRITDGYGQQELAFELVSIDTSAKTGQLWFNAGQLSSAYDSDFYIYYGNSAASLYAVTDTYGRNNVWTAYKAALHLEESNNTTAGGYKNALGSNDFTGNSMSVANTTGQIGKGAQFDGVDDYLSNAGVLGMTANTAVLSGWAYLDSSAEHGTFIKVGSTSTGYGIGIGGTTFEDTGTQIILIFEGVRWITTGSFPLNFPYTPRWVMFHMVINASGVPTVYVDGVSVGSFSGTTPVAPATSSGIGGYNIANRYFNGALDELRVGAFIPSAAWIAAEYKNQKTPSSFYSISQRQESQLVEDASGVLLRDGNLVNVYETSFYYPNGKLKFQGQINRLEAEFAPEVNGIIKAICHSDGRDLDNLVARGLPFTYTGDVSQTSQNATVTAVSSGGKLVSWDLWGQSWVAGAATLGRIQLLLNGSAHVTINVYSSPGLGGGILGTTTQYVSVGGATVIDFLFPDLITTTIGASYFFEVRVDAGESILIYYSSANPYASGSLYESTYSGGGGGGYGISTGNDMYFTTASGVPGSLATYTSVDPTSAMLVSIMNDYLSRAGNISYASGDIDPTGLSLTASFNTNTIYESIGKILDMSPSGFYYYVDIGLNKLRFKRTGKTADYLLVRGRHIEDLTLAFSIENVINEELFSGGATAGVNLYSKYTDPTSKGFYGPRLNRKSDNRVTVQGTADAIGKSDIRQFRDEQYYTTVSLMARTMNITDIKLGQLVGFRGYGSFIDNMLLQITKIDYTPERVNLQLGTLPLRFNQGFEDVIRGLVAEQTVGNPSTPS